MQNTTSGLSSSNMPIGFSALTLTGVDAAKFLQGQLTLNVNKLNNSPLYWPTAICNLQGRVQFGLWVKQVDENSFVLVTASDCFEALSAHIKKFGAFSKMTASPSPIYIALQDIDDVTTPTFSSQPPVLDGFTTADDLLNAWCDNAIKMGIFCIQAATQGLFQPQELRLHQRGGVDYDKGCYLGQEVVARLWFKAKPKAYLHVIQGKTNQLPSNAVLQAGQILADDVQIVNVLCTQNANPNMFEALVVARPETLTGFNVLPFANPALNANVARG